MFWFSNLTFLILIAANAVRAQVAPAEAQTPIEESAEDFTWWYVSLFVLTMGLVAAVMWSFKSKKERKATAAALKKNQKNKVGKAETSSLDFDKELEWLRKNQNLIKKNGSRQPKKNSLPNKASNNVSGNNSEKLEIVKMEKAEEIMPVFKFEKPQISNPYIPLPLSNEEALMSAIEQTQDEFEEDEAVRDLALRILTAFKTRNSVEALSQMALYDLSANLRSKAVTILSEFNHETVFETILLASADPTREVRAAAARALSKLTIDRADAWCRIYESGEKGRMLQAARAATESGIVKMSFDRLIHADKKYSYEAFVLMVLLIHAGETEEIFHALENNKNINVRKALMHVIKTTKNQESLDNLLKIVEEKKLLPELRTEAEKIFEEIGMVAA